MPGHTENDWKVWSNHVLAELTRLGNEQVRTHDAVSRLRDQVGFLRGRAAGFGVTAGLLASLVMFGLNKIWAIAMHH